jgi:tRNA uridine 5-carboxymethylaminomethyl modification enzyme
VLEQAEVQVKYQGYIDRQIREASRIADLARRRIPDGIDYRAIPGLSRELADKLSAVRPISFAQASRIDGMTPAALQVLSIWTSRRPAVPRGTSGA